MAKISPVSIKYMVYCSFASEGPVEKPDVIGAIFGQTEGLLGNDLEMRELQKEGKIGRIEVDLNTVDGKTVGEIKLPSALDKSETTIIAATLETIDRIGPTEAKIQVTKIEDVRGNKRDYIIERAKRLLEGLDNAEGTDLSQTLKDESRAARMQEYGEEKLPSGDLSGSEIIVVEGRADVVNLLKNRVNNVIGMNGAKLPREIAVLGKSKEITLFVDGDRGGRLIIKNVLENANIAYIAVAPDGKEVEELTGKEILISLRKKLPVREFLERDARFGMGDSPEHEMSKEDAKKILHERYNEVAGKKKALLLDRNLEVIKQISPTEIIMAINRLRRDVFAIVIDGTATKGIIEVCDERGVHYVAAKNFAEVNETNVILISL